MQRRKNPHPGEGDTETFAPCMQREEYSRNEHLRFERLISDLSARFAILSLDEVDREIERALEQVLDFFQGDRCGLLGVRPDRKFVWVTHAWYAEGIKHVSGDINLAELFPWSCQMLLDRGNHVHVTRMVELPPEAEKDRRSWAAMGVKSSLTIPLFIEERVSSLIVINAIRWELSWPEEYVPRLRLLGEIFVNALERKRADRALRESEARLQLATDSADAGLWIMELDTGRVWVTGKLRELFKFTADEELTYESFVTVIYPEDRKLVLDAVHQTVQTRAELRVEYRIVCPDGSIRWISARGRTQCDASGSAERLMGASVDITERKLMEKQVEAAAAEWQKTFDTIQDPIMILDRDFRIVRTNAATSSFFGLPPKQIVGSPCYVLMHGTDEPIAGCPYKKTRESKSHEETELYDERRGMWLHVTVDPILDETETLSWVVHTVRDITERKQAEESLKESEEALRNSQKDLRRLAGKLISAQEEELRRLARELHDDLTQRLAVLAIEAGKLELELRKMPGSFSGPSEKIVLIKDQLIKVSEDVHRISRQLHPTILDDLGLVRAIESECAAIMRRENVAIIFRSEDVPDVIPGDISLCLYRVVQEGTKNMITHSRAKNCEIFLSGIDNTLCLTVSDTGIGFDPVEVRHKPGLGLSSMRERVSLVQGDISIKSQPGQGTVINVRVPLRGSGS